MQAPVAKAQSPTVTPSGADVTTSNDSGETDSSAKKIPRKRGRPRKSTTGAVPPKSNHAATSSEGEAPVQLKPKPRPAQERSSSPQSLGKKPPTPQSPVHDVSPAKETSDSQTEERNPFMKDAHELDTGHRRSARAKKQTDFYGRTPTSKKGGSKQKATGSVRDPRKSDGEKLVNRREHVPPESIESPIPSVVGSAHDEHSEQLASDGQVVTEEDPDPIPCIFNKRANKADIEDATGHPTGDLPPTVMSSFESSLARDFGDKVQVASDADSETQWGTPRSVFSPESTPTDPATPLEVTTEREPPPITTNGDEAIYSPKLQDSRRVGTPKPASDAIPSVEAADCAPTPESLVQTFGTPPTTRARRTREPSPILGSEVAPGPLQEVVNYSNGDNGNERRDTDDKQDTAIPKRRRRRESPVVALPALPNDRDGQSTQKDTTVRSAAKAQPTKPNDVPPTQSATQSHNVQEHATRKQQQPPTPKTPRRTKRPQDAGGSTNTITASGAGSCGRGWGTKTLGATPSSVSSTSSSYAASLAARYPHLSKSAKRVSLFSSLVPDDPEDEDEPAMNVLTPTSIASVSSPTLPSFSSPSAARFFRARLGSSSTARARSRSGTPSLMAVTPRRGVGVRLFGPKDASATADPKHGRVDRSFSPSSPGDPNRRRRTTTLGDGPQSSPLASVSDVSRSAIGAMAPPDTETPSRRAEKRSAPIEQNSHVWERKEGEMGDGEEDGTVLLTPGGTTRQCGVDGFACERTFCFTCSS